MMGNTSELSLLLFPSGQKSVTMGFTSHRGDTLTTCKMGVCLKNQRHLSKNCLNRRSLFRKSQCRSGRDSTAEELRYKHHHKASNVVLLCRNSSELGDAAVPFK